MGIQPNNTVQTATTNLLINHLFSLRPADVDMC